MAESRHPDIEPRADAANLKALVVDDQELNRRVMKILLKEFGCSIVLAESGDEGVTLARAERFDVIFMDLNMPDMDGDETTRRIRASGASKSGYIVRWTTESALWLDPGLYDGQTLKPISVPALAQVVSEAVRRRGREPKAYRFALRNISPN